MEEKAIRKEYDVCCFMKDKEKLEKKIQDTKTTIDVLRNELYDYENELEKLINIFLFLDSIDFWNCPK